MRTFLFYVHRRDTQRLAHYVRRTTFVAPANKDSPTRLVHETVWIIPSVTVMHLLKSHYPELDTAIVGTALFGRIGVDRLRLAKALIL